MKRLITKRLQEWKKSQTRKPLILDGVRQVGKTYTLLELGKQFDDCHYFDFEKEPALHRIFDYDLDPKRILQELALNKNSSINQRKDLIFFDEIQECPSALTSLKYFHEELPHVAICSAGSLLGVHLNQKSFPVGKVDMLRLRPMSFEEFLLANGEGLAVKAIKEASYEQFPTILHDKLWSLLKHYFIVGGLPEVVKTYVQEKSDYVSAFAKVRTLQNTLYKGYVADMTKHSGKVNAMHLERVFKAVPEQLSKEQDSLSSKFQFRGVVPKIKEYSRLVGAIDWLQKAGLIVKVSIVNQGLLPFSAYCKENTFKLFMFDVGMLGALSSLSPNAILGYEYGSYKGYFAENFVLQEFLANEKGPLYAWQESSAQVEFLIEKAGRVIPIEIKAGNVTKAKSLRVFAEKYKPPFRVKISGKPMSVSNDGLVRNYPLYLAGFYCVTF